MGSFFWRNNAPVVVLPNQDKSGPNDHHYHHRRCGFLLDQNVEKSEINQAGKGTNAPFGGLKLSNCPNVPFSSNLGRLLVEKSRHLVQEESILKRLERNEWYINRSVRHGGSALERVADDGVCCSKRMLHAHFYKPPKRQQHYKSASFHSAEFIGRFCKPVRVNLERVDLKVLQARINTKVLGKRKEMRSDKKLRKKKLLDISCNVLNDKPNRSNRISLRQRVSKT